MDDVNEPDKDEKDIQIFDKLCRAFKAASGAIHTSTGKPSSLASAPVVFQWPQGFT
jgi:hypothetical protein